MEGGEWSNFNAAVCVNEEADFMAQLFPNNSNDVNSNYGHNHHSHNNNYHRNNNNNVVVDGGSSYYSPDSTTSNSQNMYRYSNSQNHEVHYHNYFSDNNHNHNHNHNHSHNHSSLPIDFLHCHIEDESGVNVDLNDDLEPSPEDKSMGKTKKRPRALEAQKAIKRNVRVKISQSSLSLGGEDMEENGALVHNQISRCESLDDDCSSKGTSTTTKTTTTTTTALNSSGKTRASRGSATDPQSLYARKRRERINERLRILQSLVPNGTKVDISTMLEEAVHYVKFLQLQIKLLSSDELWMYAPIAYNGMNIGLDFQFNSPE